MLTKKMVPFEIDYIDEGEYSLIQHYYDNPIQIVRELWEIVYSTIN
jgi:hypothetical protein